LIVFELTRRPKNAHGERDGSLGIPECLDYGNPTFSTHLVFINTTSFGLCFDDGGEITSLQLGFLQDGWSKVDATRPSGFGFVGEQGWGRDSECFELKRHACVTATASQTAYVA
jgi:hypothetical protein